MSNKTLFDGHLRDIVKLLKTGKLCGYWQSFDGGENIRLFEQKFANYVGAKHAIAVSNGTTSIFVGLLACGVKKGDIVAVSPYTHVGSVAPILMAGAIPKFIDVDEFGNIDPDEINEPVNAIIAAHQIGLPCNMDKLKSFAESKNIPLIEDNAQGLGADYNNRKLGSIGDVGCFSIGGDMTKMITTGEGGVITTDSEAIATKCRNLRNHGDTMGADYLCFNARMPEILGLIGLIQMDHLEYQIKWQKRNAEHLIANLPKYLTVPKIPSNVKPAHYIIGCVFHEEIAGLSRAEFLTSLHNSGFVGGLPRKNIGTGYRKLVYEIPFYSKYKTPCPNAEEKTKTAIWIDWVRYPRIKKEINELIAFLGSVTD